MIIFNILLRHLHWQSLLRKPMRELMWLYLFGLSWAMKPVQFVSHHPRFPRLAQSVTMKDILLEFFAANFANVHEP